MVELLTDYTTQIYHALSTDARPTANPGDQLREIDTGKRFIFDGSTWNELPDGGGGGLPEGITAIATGTYTPASTVGSYTFTHNLGVKPKLFAVVLDTYPWYPSLNDHLLMFAALGESSGSSSVNVREHTTNNATLQYSYNNADSFTTETVAYISRTNSSAGAFQPRVWQDADHTVSVPTVYRWWAIA